MGLFEFDENYFAGLIGRILRQVYHRVRPDTTRLARWLTRVSVLLLAASAGLWRFADGADALVVFLIGIVVALVALVLHFKPIFEDLAARREKRAEAKARVRQRRTEINVLMTQLLALADTYHLPELIDVDAAPNRPNAENRNRHRLNEAWQPLNGAFWGQLHRPLEDLVRDLSREGVDVVALEAAIRAPSTPDDLRQMVDLLSDVTDALDA